jgi:hypothetical protein
MGVEGLEPSRLLRSTDFLTTIVFTTAEQSFYCRRTVSTVAVYSRVRGLDYTFTF